MADRPLSSGEAALWARVLETVRPLRIAPKPVAKVPAASATLAKTTHPPLASKHAAALPGKAAQKVATPTGASGSELFQRLLEQGVGSVVSKARAGARARPQPFPAPAPRHHVAHSTLDGSWDKKLARGLVSPDRSIDLHGHNLSTAYATLDGALEQSIRMGDRVVLLVTGKPPRPESERPHARGAIRAAIGDWLAGSRHASAIAAVRNAHPRHGGAGALYIVLRRTEPNRVY
ncbi:Smr/MutS family protein [Sphingomonas qilianensis]|uniref:Smr/MutS family protein n=1 Tax=Sphingomonas qilianensis TaxID=1736690 RepID=A0ABU9XNZ2_9SPHN